MVVLGHNMEVARNHQTEESGSVELRNSLKPYSFSERIFWHFDTRTIESHFPARWPCRALSASWKRKCAHFSCHRCMGKILLLLLHYFTTNQMLKCSRSPPISLPSNMMAFLYLPVSFFFKSVSFLNRHRSCASQNSGAQPWQRSSGFLMFCQL